MAIRWKNVGRPAVVVAIGGAVQVRYHVDGSLGWTTFARCRVLP